MTSFFNVETEIVPNGSHHLQTERQLFTNEERDEISDVESEKGPITQFNRIEKNLRQKVRT